MAAGTVCTRQHRWLAIGVVVALGWLACARTPIDEEPVSAMGQSGASSGFGGMTGGTQNLGGSYEGGASGAGPSGGVGTGGAAIAGGSLGGIGASGGEGGLGVGSGTSGNGGQNRSGGTGTGGRGAGGTPAGGGAIGGRGSNLGGASGGSGNGGIGGGASAGRGGLGDGGVMGGSTATGTTGGHGSGGGTSDTSSLGGVGTGGTGGAGGSGTASGGGIGGASSLGGGGGAGGAGGAGMGGTGEFGGSPLTSGGGGGASSLGGGSGAGGTGGGGMGGTGGAGGSGTPSGGGFGGASSPGGGGSGGTSGTGVGGAGETGGSGAGGGSSGGQAICGDGIVEPGEQCDLGAANADRPAFVVTQHSLVFAVTPYAQVASSANFYDYVSSSGHTGLEKLDTSLILLYLDRTTTALSLIIEHGIDASTTSQQQPASRVQMLLSGLPAGCAVGVSDDAGELVMSSATTAAGGWSFNGNTDGGVLTGFPIPGSWEVLISPAFLGGITSWTWIQGSSSVVNLDLTVPIDIKAYASPSLCRTDCTIPRCGDGILDGGEVCDDGNNVDGDGCSSDCLLAQ